MDRCRFRSSHTCGASSKGHPESELQNATPWAAAETDSSLCRRLLGCLNAAQAVACPAGAGGLHGAITKLAMNQRDHTAAQPAARLQSQPAYSAGQAHLFTPTTSSRLQHAADHLVHISHRHQLCGSLTPPATCGRTHLLAVCCPSSLQHTHQQS